MRISSNINRVIGQLELYKSKLDIRLNQIIESLSKEGFDIARYKFMNAKYAGENDVKCDIVWENDLSCYVIASGYAVLFIEFGSGTFYYEHPNSPYTRGTYGKGLGANPPWKYKGYIGDNRPMGTEYATNKKGDIVHTKDGQPLIKTMGNPPAMAMYEAGARMHQRVKEIAEEVFG